MTVSDPNGASLHVATAGAPFTNITVMENTFCSGLPCGVTYWNPATNVFKCYGYSSGSMTGVDVNVSAPLIAPPAGTAAPPTNGGNYGPGDTWLAKSGSFSTSSAPGFPLTVQFPVTNLFRSWGAGNMSSVAVDQSTGLIWVTDQNGFVGVFDPATNVLKRWNVGGLPRDIVPVPGTGLAYATVGPSAGAGDEIIEVDRTTDASRRWAVPAAYVGHPLTSLQGFFNAFHENPNGIALDSAARIWFAESISDEIGRLDPGTDTFAEYRKVGPTGANAIDEPQNVAASGAGASLQAFFSEGGGNATGIVTPAEAAGTAQEVITVVSPTAGPSPTTHTLTPFDHTHVPSEKAITPTVHPVDGIDGVPWTDPGPKTAANEVIPGVLRFPFPAGFFRAVGMTEVLIPNTVFGSLIGPAGSFPSPPTDEHVFELTSGAIIAQPEVGGRMNGGGSILGSKAQHGFQLHCNVSQPPNNLEVNFGQGDKFHLEVFSTVSCTDDPTIEERPPVAGFDTIAGSGMGRFNGVSGATIEFKFSDAGEPGKTDSASIKIVAGATTVLDIAGTLLTGNHQALPASDGDTPLNASTLPASEWMLTGSGYALVFPALDSSDPGTELCTVP
ncbi:MAG: hypothetical protein HY613_07885 [Candidatus Rokubacteria bacterium]|nr:hypothetical protein [Candidatus Rokubacteria bacterium]